MRGRPARRADRPLPLPHLPQGAWRCLCLHSASEPRAFPLDQGEDKLSSYESSPGKLRQFCSVCGSQLLAVRAGQPAVILRVGSLDEDPGLRPQFHIWTAHHAPWLDYEGLPEHMEWQPGR